MGQLTSSEPSGNPHKQTFTTQQIRNLFDIRAASLLSNGYISSIASSINIKDVSDANVVLTPTDLAALLNFTEKGRSEPDEGEVGSESSKPQGIEGETHVETEIHEESPTGPVLAILYRSFTILGRLPFPAVPASEREQLTLKKFLVAIAVHSGCISKIWPELDYLKLVFISLALMPISDQGQDNNEKHITPPAADSQDEKTCESENVQNDPESSPADTKLDEKLTVEVSMEQQGIEESPKVTSRRIRWNTLKPLITYNDLAMGPLSVSAYDLVQVFTLLLVVNSIPDQAHAKMSSQLWKLASQKWKAFETVAFSLLRYVDVNITSANCRNTQVSYEAYKNGMENAMSGFVASNFKRFLKISLLSSVMSVSEAEKSKQDNEKQKKASKPFEPTRLVDEATLSLLSLFMKDIESSVEVTPQNVVELYNGAQSGFSIRSLESKIFKWRSPTIFLVSGKRLRSKTIQKNKRYQQFDSEYPRYFRSSEDPKKSWQSDNDRVTYAVFVSQPWKNSNKLNVGDEDTAIMAISPRYDHFSSKKGLLSAGKSIYFNNQGMGIGFGNDQPVNKNNVRKFQPGSVSLTIEANLEFGVFRHIVNARANTSRHFQTSAQATVRDQDYEDRFVITDLEVLGVGSTKELEEQRKEWEWEEKQARARQGVNIGNLGEERAFLEMAGLAGNHGSGGSV